MLEILSNKKQLKGEIVLLIAQGAKENMLDEEIVQKLKLLKAQGFSSKDAAKIVATILDVKKTRAYDLLSYT
jgi:16S rRNA C1402 (ribose-2'-O) methylase RsmI